MRACDACQQQNPDDAQFCLRCGKEFLPEAAPEDPPETDQEEQYWRTLIGPGKCVQFTLTGGWSWKPAWDYYRRMFQRFHSAQGPRFSLTWNWAPFFVEPFLWFLYRKMYLFAFVYFIGPIVSVFVTNDISVPIVWSIIASASANYVYYWHLRDLVLKVKARVGLDHGARMRQLTDGGGVQPYVFWLVAASLLLKAGVFFAVLGESPLEDELPLPDGEPGGEEMEGRRMLL